MSARMVNTPWPSFPDMRTVEIGNSHAAAHVESRSLRRWLKWCCIVAVAAFCIYRLAIFTPQPLDSPGSLRPFLFRIFDWWSHLYATPETMLSVWSDICLVFLCIPPALSLAYDLWARQKFRLPVRSASYLFSRRLFLGSIAACLLLCRFPILLLDELNPDEGEFLFAAHQLFHDGNFFHAVDCHTSGPLNVYPLMLPAVFGASPDFASSRLIGLLAIFLSVYFLYRACALIVPEEIARLAILPVVAAFCVFKNTELLHMSSEHIPLVWISIAAYLATRILRNSQAHRKPLFLLGVLISAAFFTKLQSVPIIVALAGVAVLFVRVSRATKTVWAPALFVFAGALPLLLLNALVCLVSGVWKDFWISYVVSNWIYPGMPGLVTIDFRGFLELLFRVNGIRFLIFTAIVLGAAYVFQRIRSRQTSSAEAILRWFAILAFASFASALWAVYLPHRPFVHYLLLLVPPLGLVMAWLLARIADDSRDSHVAVFVSVFTILLVACQSYLWRLPVKQTFGDTRNQPLKHIGVVIRPPEGDFIRSLTSPRDQIRVWGWTMRPYLGSGREGEGKDTHILYCFRTDRFRSYYIHRFLADMQRRPPAVFIDATGPTSWFFNDSQAFRFERFPEIAGFVKANYVHLADVYGQRYFLRRDLARAREALFAIPLPSKACNPAALLCLKAATTLPEELPPVQIPENAVLETEFVSVQPQIGPATVFNNEAVPNSYRGFRFFHTVQDRYILLVGTGQQWTGSREFVLPDREPVSLTIRFDGNVVNIACNAQHDELHLPHPIANSPGPINLNSWIGSADPFAGKMQFFEISETPR